MILLSWILALAGAIVAWSMFLADAMSSGPRLDRITVSVLALPMPAIAAVLASIKLYRALDSSVFPSAGLLLAIGTPLLIALSTLLILIVAFFLRGG